MALTKQKGRDEIHNKIVQAGSAIQEKVTPSWNLGRRLCFFPLGPSQLANICSPCLHRAGDPTAAALWGLAQPAACICFSFSYSSGYNETRVTPGHIYRFENNAVEQK